MFSLTRLFGYVLLHRNRGLLEFLKSHAGGVNDFLGEQIAVRWLSDALESCFGPVNEFCMFHIFDLTSRSKFTEITRVSLEFFE